MAVVGALPLKKETSFEDLLVRVGESQDRDAFIRLFEYFAPRVKSFLMKGGLAADAADELAQETMLAVWNKAAGYDPARAAASTWIFTIARNRRIDALRRIQRSAPAGDSEARLENEASPEPGPERRLQHEQEAAGLAQAIAALPPEQAELIRKSFFEEKTHQDIAREQGLPLGTVKSRIRLAMERLRAALGAHRADEPQNDPRRRVQ
jgi:RNA polymerase sigma-70 factor (ECF subfamily)